MFSQSPYQHLACGFHDLFFFAEIVLMQGIAHALDGGPGFSFIPSQALPFQRLAGIKENRFRLFLHPFSPPVDSSCLIDKQAVSQHHARRAGNSAVSELNQNRISIRAPVFPVPFFKRLFSADNEFFKTFASRKSHRGV